MDLVTWLRAQLDATEEDVRESRALSPDDLHWAMPGWLHRDFLVADIAAKRAILDVYEEATAWYEAHKSAPAGELEGLYTALKLLAVPYADGEPDYDESWRP